MSAITPTGTGQFPTGAQSSIGSGQLVVRKSNTADATARAWTAIANGQTLYLFIETGDTTIPLATCPFVFGDFKSYKASDQYAVTIIGRITENSSSAAVDPLHIAKAPNNIQYALKNVMFGHFIARHWTGSGGSVKAGKMHDSSKMGEFSNGGLAGGWNADNQTTADTGAAYALGRNTAQYAFPYPNGPDGALWLSPIFLNHNWALRGYLLGLWAPLHDRPLGHNDALTFSGGNLNGKSVIAQNIQALIANAQDAGQVIVETSDTWS
jgi:hypothetical protein